MRLKKDQSDFLKKAVKLRLPDADVFLFGSRALDHLKGGDIDILAIGEKRLSEKQKREIKIAFYKNFGEQKIDIVSFSRKDESPFKKLALLKAIRL